MKRHMLAATTVVALLFLLTVGAPHASADTYHLTSCHLSDGCGSATEFGTVTLTTNVTDSTSVDFYVLLNSGNRFVETGNGSELFYFNDSLGSDSTITNAYATLNGTKVDTLSITGFTNMSPVQADGTGTWTASVECTDPSACNGGDTPNINDLHFTVTNATLAQLEVTNTGQNGGNMFIADILCGQTGCTGLTGFVDVSGPSVPDGGMTLMLLGGALFGLETLRRKFRA